MKTKEFFSVIMFFKPGKTPEKDEIPIEIYQKIFDLIKQPLISYLNISFTLKVNKRLILLLI